MKKNPLSPASGNDADEGTAAPPKRPAYSHNLRQTLLNIPIAPPREKAQSLSSVTARTQKQAIFVRAQPRSRSSLARRLCDRDGDGVVRVTGGTSALPAPARRPSVRRAKGGLRCRGQSDPCFRA